MDNIPTQTSEDSQAPLIVDNSKSQQNQKNLLLLGLLILFLITSILLSYVLLRKKSASSPTVVTQPIEKVSPSTVGTKKKVDERPIGSLPYSYVSNVTVDNKWTERGVNLRANSLREFSSTDKCADMYVSDLGPLAMNLEEFTVQQYQIPTVPINSEARYKTQYEIGTYESISIGPMGQGEVSNTVVEFEGRAIGINTTLNSSISTCVFPEQSAKTLIESIRFQQ